MLHTTPGLLCKSCACNEIDRYHLPPPGQKRRQKEVGKNSTAAGRDGVSAGKECERNAVRGGIRGGEVENWQNAGQLDHTCGPFDVKID